MRPSLILSLSIIAEVAGEVCMRQSDGFAKPWWVLGTALCFLLSLWGAAIVMRTLAMSVTYAIWSGAGTALAAVAGAWLFGETMTANRLIGFALIVGGVVLLNR